MHLLQTPELMCPEKAKRVDLVLSCFYYQILTIINYEGGMKLQSGWVCLWYRSWRCFMDIYLSPNSFGCIH